MLRIRTTSLLAGLVSVTACAVNPATGERQLSLISERQEITIGQDGAKNVQASLGIVQDSALEAYVDGIGDRLAATSERPDLPWSFQVVDDPGVNAFALPGGFIYVTRGILPYFQNEAELAGVLGHEIGHVTARHSVTQMSRQQLEQLGLGVGMILSKDVRQFGDILSTGLGLLNLKYSRGDETQADELGVRYMTRAGYDPTTLEGVFQMLASVSGGAGTRVPEWQLTHPYPENREAHIRDFIASTGAPDTGMVNRDALLDHIDGLVFGEDPREGYFKDGLFLHPQLAFQLRFPDGWKTVNERTQVAAVSPGQDAAVILEPVSDTQDPEAALRTFLSGDGVTGGTLRRSEANGIPRFRATFTASTQSGDVQGEAMYFSYGGAVYRILGYAKAGAWSGYASAAGRTMESFAPVTDPAVLNVRPRRLDVVTLPRTMTLSEFAQAYPSAVDLEELGRLNRRAAGDRIPAGVQVKRVVGDPLP